MSTLGLAPIRSLSLTWPRVGAWHADVTLEGGAAGSTPPAAGARVTLTVGTLALVGTVLRSGDDAAGLPHAVLAAGAGWDRAVASPLSYQCDVGVRLSTVLRDLARLAGEPVELPADLILGEHYALPASRYGQPMRLRHALATLARGGALAAWRVDPDGVTRFGARATDGATVSGRATVLRRNVGAGLAVLGIDDAKGFAPGMVASVSASETVTIDRLCVVESSGKLEAEAWE